MLPDTFVSVVVGVTFTDTYPDNLHACVAAIEQARAVHHVRMTRAVESFDPDADEFEPPTAILHRELDNPFDPNSIAVFVPVTGTDHCIGRLPAALAARLAPLIDEGETWAAELVEVALHSEHWDRPGARVRIRKIEGPKPCPTETHTV